ncbi:MAG: class I SAM-dependent methyltransferase [Deltaproteobacteria bacterium]|nr:class I SAM-dependent methyltransferase [Deltaproteobacteria bacterium]
MERGYQYNLSRIHHDKLYDREGRERKARTAAAVLSDFLSNDLSGLTVLDVGSSTGIVGSYLSGFFGKVIGIDIDREAVEFARQAFPKSNLEFRLGDAVNLDFEDQTFSVVICMHVYEHVPDANKLISEIYRVLNPGGVCYFAAGNRLNINEAHYELPFLSVIPRPLAHVYMRLAGKGNYYYEKHLSYWGLKKLARRFEIIDYTKRIIEAPGLFQAEYMVRPGTITGALAKAVAHYAFWLCPSYIWLLRKPNY